MATPAAVLSVLVDANTTQATAKLTQYQRQLGEIEAKAAKGIRTQLGGTFNDEAFKKYQAATASAARRATDRKAFKAELGANFSPAGFRAYQREADRAGKTSASVENRVGRLTGAFKGLGAGLLAVGGGFAAYEAAKGAVETTLQLTFATSKLSAATGLDAKTASSWIEVAKIRGVQANALSMGFITLERNIRNASDGAKSAKLAFQQLGIPVKGLKDQNLEVTIGRIADSFQRLSSPVERAALAQQLFGRNAKVLLPVLIQGKAGIDDLLGAAQRYGAYIDDKQIKTFMRAHEAQLQLNLAMDGLKIAFTQVALPAIIKVAGGLLKFVQQMRDGQGVGGRFAKDVSAAFTFVRNAVGGLINLVGGMHNFAIVVGSMTAAFVAFKIATGVVAIATNPLLLAFVAIALAATEIVTHWKPISAFFVATWRTIEHAVGEGVSFVLGAVSGLLHTMADVANVKLPIFGRAFGGAAKSLDHAADSVDHLRERLRALGTTQQNVTDAALQQDPKWAHVTAKTVRDMSVNIDQLAAKMKDGTAAGTQAATRNFGQFAQAVYGAMQSGTLNTKQGAQYIQNALNSMLKAFGGKQIPAIALKEAALNTPFSASVGAFPKTGQAGGGGKPAGAARGAFVNHPMIMVGEEAPTHPEVVLSTNPAYAKRQRGLLARYLQMAPHVLGFAQGGVTSGPNFDGHPGNVSSGVRGLISTMESRFPGLIVTATTDGGHAAGSYHYRGDAVDMASDATTMLSAANYVRTSGLYKSLIEGIHNPNLSVHAGQFVSPSFWGASTWAQHANHIHLAILGALGALAGGIGQISAPQVKGGGAIGRLLGAGLGKLAGAANAYLGSHTGGGDSGSFGLPTGVGTSNAANRALGRQMMLGTFPASQWPYLDALWNKESGWNAAARNPTSGAAGIPQDITGNFHGGPSGQIAWGLNYIRGRYGSPAAAWAHEQKFNWYAKGGILPFAGSFDQGGTVPGPRGMPSMAVVHGGERITGLAGGGIIGRALAGHPAWRIPLNLPALATIPSQSTSGQIQLQGLQNTLTSAQNVGNVGGQRSALNRILKLEQGWLTADRQQLKKINKALRKKGLTKKQRQSLLGDKLALLQEIGTVEADIGSTQTSISDLTSTTDTTGGGTTGGDTGGGSDANQALADAINAQTQALTDATNAINMQTAAINGIGAIEKQQAIKALADVISGQIGGQYYSRATGSAGDGRVARY